MIRHTSPAAAGVAWGSRIMRHCDCAKIRRSEESCISNGVATGSPSFAGAQCRAQIILAAVVAAQRLAQDRRFGCVAARIRIAAKRAQQGHKKNHSGDERGDRISRQSKDYHRPKAAMEYRFARPHRDLPKVQFHALPGERRFDEIMIAHRHAAERHQNIGARIARGLDAFVKRTQFVPSDAEVERLAARGLDERGDGEGIRGNDLIGANGLRQDAPIRRRSRELPRAGVG